MPRADVAVSLRLDYGQFVREADRASKSASEAAIKRFGLHAKQVSVIAGGGAARATAYSGLFSSLFLPITEPFRRGFSVGKTFYRGILAEARVTGRGIDRELNLSGVFQKAAGPLRAFQAKLATPFQPLHKTITEAFSPKKLPGHGMIFGKGDLKSLDPYIAKIEKARKELDTLTGGGGGSGPRSFFGGIGSRRIRKDEPLKAPLRKVEEDEIFRIKKQQVQDLKDFILGSKPAPSAPSVLYRGVPRGKAFTGGLGTPWPSIAFRGGKGGFGGKNDVYEVPSKPDQTYYRGGAWGESPLENTRIMNAAGMKWEQVLDRAKQIYERRVPRINATVRKQASEGGFDEEWIKEVTKDKLQSELARIITDIFNASYETDLTNAPGRWSGGNLPKRFNRPNPKLATDKELEMADLEGGGVAVMHAANRKVAQKQQELREKAAQARAALAAEESKLAPKRAGLPPDNPQLLAAQKAVKESAKAVADLDAGGGMPDLRAALKKAQADADALKVALEKAAEARKKLDEVSPSAMWTGKGRAGDQAKKEWKSEIEAVKEAWQARKKLSGMESAFEESKKAGEERIKAAGTPGSGNTKARYEAYRKAQKDAINASSRVRYELRTALMQPEYGEQRGFFRQLIETYRKSQETGHPMPRAELRTLAKPYREKMSQVRLMASAKMAEYHENPESIDPGIARYLAPFQNEKKLAAERREAAKAAWKQSQHPTETVEQARAATAEELNQEQAALEQTRRQAAGFDPAKAALVARVQASRKARQDAAIAAAEAEVKRTAVPPELSGVPATVGQPEILAEQLQTEQEQLIQLKAKVVDDPELENKIRRSNERIEQLQKQVTPATEVPIPAASAPAQEAPRFFQAERTVGDVKEGESLGAYITPDIEAAKIFAGTEGKIREVRALIGKVLSISPGDPEYPDIFKPEEINKQLAQAGVKFKFKKGDEQEFFKFLDEGGPRLVKAVKAAGFEGIQFPEVLGNKKTVSTLVFDPSKVTEAAPVQPQPSALKPSATSPPDLAVQIDQEKQRLAGLEAHRQEQAATRQQVEAKQKEIAETERRISETSVVTGKAPTIASAPQQVATAQANLQAEEARIRKAKDDAQADLAAQQAMTAEMSPADAEKHLKKFQKEATAAEADVTAMEEYRKTGKVTDAPSGLKEYIKQLQVAQKAVEDLKDAEAAHAGAQASLVAAKKSLGDANTAVRNKARKAFMDELKDAPLMQRTLVKFGQAFPKLDKMLGGEFTGRGRGVLAHAARNIRNDFLLGLKAGREPSGNVFDDMMNKSARGGRWQRMVRGPWQRLLMRSSRQMFGGISVAEGAFPKAFGTLSNAFPSFDKFIHSGVRKGTGEGLFASLSAGFKKIFAAASLVALPFRILGGVLLSVVGGAFRILAGVAEVTFHVIYALVRGLIGLAYSLAKTFLYVGTAIVTIAAIGIAKAIDWAKTIASLSRETGIASRDILLLGHALDRSDVSAQSATAMMDQLRKTLRFPDEGAALALNALGLSGAALKQMDLPHAFAAIANEANRIQDPMARNAMLVSLLGAEGAKAATKFRPGDLDRAIAMYGGSVEKFNLATRSLEEAHDHWNRIKSAGTEFFKQLTVPIAPVLEKAATLLEGKLIPLAQKWGEVIGSKLGKGLTIAAGFMELLTGKTITIESGDKKEQVGWVDFLKTGFAAAFGWGREKFREMIEKGKGYFQALIQFAKEALGALLVFDWSPMLKGLLEVFKAAAGFLAVAIRKAVGLLPESVLKTPFTPDVAAQSKEEATALNMPEGERLEGMVDATRNAFAKLYRRENFGAVPIFDKSLERFKNTFQAYLKPEAMQMPTEEFARQFGQRKNGETFFPSEPSQFVDPLRASLDDAFNTFLQNAPGMAANVGQGMESALGKAADTFWTTINDPGAKDKLGQLFKATFKLGADSIKNVTRDAEAIKDKAMGFILKPQYDELRRIGGGLGKNTTGIYALTTNRLLETINQTALTGFNNLTNAVTGMTGGETGKTADRRPQTDTGQVPPEVKKAAGFDGWVNSPTRFLVGEAGPEYVSVVPERRMIDSSQSRELQKSKYNKRLLDKLNIAPPIRGGGTPTPVMGPRAEMEVFGRAIHAAMGYGEQPKRKSATSGSLAESYEMSGLPYGFQSEMDEAMHASTTKGPMYDKTSTVPASYADVINRGLDAFSPHATSQRSPLFNKSGFKGADRGGAKRMSADKAFTGFKSTAGGVKRMSADKAFTGFKSTAGGVKRMGESSGQWTVDSGRSPFAGAGDRANPGGGAALASAYRGAQSGLSGGANEILNQMKAHLAAIEMNTADIATALGVKESGNMPQPQVAESTG